VFKIDNALTPRRLEYRTPWVLWINPFTFPLRHLMVWASLKLQGLDPESYRLEDDNG
jgi:hypothetical protein